MSAPVGFLLGRNVRCFLIAIDVNSGIFKCAAGLFLSYSRTRDLDLRFS